METENVETSLVSMLPDDVLFEVFDFLKTRDRNNAKLVCKSWLRILNRTYFAQTEAVFFANYYDVPTIVKVIDELDRDELNLRFENRQFLPNCRTLWEKCGKKIKSLDLSRCSFYPDIMWQIFHHCVNLKEFSLCNCEFSSNRKLMEKFGPLQLQSFFKLNRCSLRENVSKLELGSLFLDVTDLSEIASKFPKLKTLAIWLTEDIEAFLSTLLNLLDTRMHDIEKLDLHFTNTHDFPENLSGLQKLFSSNSTKKITMSLDINPELFTENNISRISSYKFLRSLNLSEYNFGGVPLCADMTLLARFLDGIPMLNDLRFNMYLTTSREFCTIWSSLVNSHLYCLQINMDHEYPYPNRLRRSIPELDSLLDGLTRNKTVRFLKISDDGNGEFNLLFVKYFQGVWDLSMVPGDPKVTFQYQTEVRKLWLDTKRPKNIVSTSTQTTIENIEFINIARDMIDVFSLYRFPNLRYISINFYREYYPLKIKSQKKKSSVRTMRNLLNDDLQNLVSTLLLTSPEVESVELMNDHDEMETFELFFQFCCKFPNLRYRYLFGEFFECTYFQENII